MKTIHQHFQVDFSYDVHFTEGVFDLDNQLLNRIISRAQDPHPKKSVVVLDDGLLPHYPDLFEKITSYAREMGSFEVGEEPIVIPGGERAKVEPGLVDRLHRAAYAAGLDRHSFVIVVGGGSVIDLAGYAAATAHRGIRLIRIPTTVLSQNDAAVGVKNGINAFNTKNFLGTFAPPFAVVNDAAFLKTLDDRDWRAGISEAVKVALVKDASFFDVLEQNADRLTPEVRDAEAMNDLIVRCAELHLKHISTSGDPFETGTSRPLDFGHWAAHKLEQLTEYELRHGEAVAVGIALDSWYSMLEGRLDPTVLDRILSLLQRLGFLLYVPELAEYLDQEDHPRNIFQGLEAFREHLGGELTIMLLEEIGRGVEVHHINRRLYRRAIERLRELHLTGEGVRRGEAENVG